MLAASEHSPPVERIVPMNRTAEDPRFELAPPIGVQRRLGLIKGDNLNINRRALMVALVGWAPLILLAIVQSAWLGLDDVTPVLWEVGLHAALISLPRRC